MATLSKEDKELFNFIINDPQSTEEEKKSAREVLEKFGGEKTTSTKKASPKKTTAKKTSTKKATTKSSASDLEKKKAELKKKTGKTLEECEKIIEQYKALKSSDATQKKKETTQKVKAKKRSTKLKKEGKVIKGTTEKNAEATLNTATKKVVKKLDKQVDKIQKTSKTEKQVEQKITSLVTKAVRSNKKLFTDTAKELAKVDKNNAKQYLMSLKKEIDTLLKKYEYGGMLPSNFGQAGLVGETGAMNEIDLFAMGGSLPQGVHQYYAQTYNPAYPTPHGYAKGGNVYALVDGFDEPTQNYDQVYYKTDDYNQLVSYVADLKNEREYSDDMNIIEVMPSGKMRKFDASMFAKGGMTDEYVAITLKPKKSSYKGGKGEVYKNMQTFYDTINAKENEDKYDFIHSVFISDSRKSHPQDISEIRVYMIGEKSGFDDVEKRGLYDLFDLVKTKEEVKDYAKGGKLDYDKGVLPMEPMLKSGVFDGRKYKFVDKVRNPIRGTYKVVIQYEGDEFTTTMTEDYFNAKIRSERLKQDPKYYVGEKGKQRKLNFTTDIRKLKRELDKLDTQGNTVVGYDRNSKEYYWEDYKNDIYRDGFKTEKYAFNNLIGYLEGTYAKGGMVKLESVGSLIDVKKGLIYPQYEDGKADFSNPISLRDEEVSSDWYESLSPKDYKVVEKATKSFAKGGMTDNKNSQIIAEIEEIKSEITERPPYVYEREGQIKLSSEEGDEFSDYYGEFYEPMYVDSRLEAIADKYNSYWDWENAGTLVLVQEYAKGGKTQGYNDKLDESLGNTKGKRSTKEQNYKDRRNESEAMEKKGGKRKYARVKTMDKGTRKKRKTPMTLAKAIRKDGEKWQDAVKRATIMMKKEK